MAEKSEIYPSLAVRSNVGVEVWTAAGFKSPYIQNTKFARDESKFCRAIEFSPDGKHLAYGNGTVVQICTTTDWKRTCTLPRPKAFSLQFSPKGTYIMTWEIFFTNKDNPEGAPNMYIYEAETGKEVYSAIQKRQTDWEPCWTADEATLGVMLGGEVLFYDIKNAESFKTSTLKLGGGKNGKFTFSPGNKPYYAFYVPGVKGAPSMCKLFQYPVVNAQQAIGCKSFFQADRVDMLWNKKGTDVLLLTSTEVDQTGASYYGKQALHFMSTKGESCSVHLKADGPIHAVHWSPKSNEFCVVYGYMPSHAALFNLKCDVVFDFATGSRNAIYFNPHGNILLLAGFGNLRGYIEVWDLEKKTQTASMQAPDSTMLEWNPRGDIFVTATTAPRLRMANGFKMWHYSGALLHETLFPAGHELYDVQWQKYPSATFPEPVIKSEKIEGIKSSIPQASTQVYRPPNVRLGIDSMDDDKNDSKPKIPGLYTTGANKSGGNEKKDNRKKREYWKRDKKPGEDDSGANSENPQTPRSERRVNNPRNNRNRNARGKNENGDDENGKAVQGGGDSPQKSLNENRRNQIKKPAAAATGITGDPEKDKRIKTINRKLQDIAKLKGRQERGELLEANQVSKISNEIELITELKNLSVTA